MNPVSLSFRLRKAMVARRSFLLSGRTSIASRQSKGSLSQFQASLGYQTSTATLVTSGCPLSLKYLQGGFSNFLCSTLPGCLEIRSQTCLFRVHMNTGKPSSLYNGLLHRRRSTMLLTTLTLLCLRYSNLKPALTQS